MAIPAQAYRLNRTAPPATVADPDIVPDPRVAPGARVEAVQTDGWERLAEVAGDAFDRSPLGSAARWIAGAIPSADDWSGEPGADNSPAALSERARARVTQAERDRREQYDARALDDPWNRDPGFSLGNVARGATNIAGMMGGAVAGDPTTFIAPGATLARQMASQTAVAVLADLATQGSELAEGVRDDIDPVQTGMAAALGVATPAIAAGAKRVAEAAGLRTVRDRVADPAEQMTPDERAADTVVRREGEVDAASPYLPDSAGAAAHRGRLAAAMEAVLAGVPERIGRALRRDPSPVTVDPRALAPAAMDGYLAAIRGAESGGDDLAAATTSSAFGRYQFLKGTWRDLYVRRFGRGGLSDDQIHAKRADPQLQETLIRDFTRDNIRALQRARLTPDAGALYLSHFAGSRDAIRVLSAGRDTPVSAVLDADSIAANPGVFGVRAKRQVKTAGDLRDWATRKAGGTVAAADVPAIPRAVAEGLQREADAIAARRAIGPGEPEQVVTARGWAIDTEFEVREAASLIDSADARFDVSLQPRDRAGRAASDVQIAAIAADLDPAQLASSRLAAQGAPIVGGDGMVESGNGRIGAIRRAYAELPERAAAYRAMVEAVDPAAAAMAEPVLVRRRVTELDTEDRQRWVREANERDTMQMSGTEQAAADARALSAEAVAAFRGGEITDARNRGFVRAFLNEAVPGSEINALVDAAGVPNADGIRRIGRAMLVRAYEAPDVVAEIAEATDSNIKAIGSVLTRVAPQIAQLRDLIAAGKVDPAYDLSPFLADVARRVRDTRDAKGKIGDILRQEAMFANDAVAPETAALLRLFFRGEALDSPRSADTVADVLDGYVARARQGEDMLGHRPSAEELIYDGRADVAGEGEPRFAPVGRSEAPDGAGGRAADDGGQVGEPGRETGTGGDRDDAGALDLGAATDPNIAAVQRQQTDLRAASPMRAGVDQDSTIGAPLFDAADQPGLALEAAAVRRAETFEQEMAAWDEPDGGAAAAQAASIAHDLEVLAARQAEGARGGGYRIDDPESEAGGSAADVQAGLAEQRAFLDTLKGCL